MVKNKGLWRSIATEMLWVKILAPDTRWNVGMSVNVSVRCYYIEENKCR